MGRGTLEPSESGWVLGKELEPGGLGSLPNKPSSSRYKSDRQCPISTCNLSNVFLKLQRSRLSPKCDLRVAEVNVWELEPAILPLRLELDTLPGEAKRDAETVFDRKAFAGKSYTNVARLRLDVFLYSRR